MTAAQEESTTRQMLAAANAVVRMELQSTWARVAVLEEQNRKLRTENASLTAELKQLSERLKAP